MNIHRNDVRGFFFYGLQCLNSIANRSDDFYFRVGVQYINQKLPRHRRIFNHQHFNHDVVTFALNEWLT